MDHNKGASKYIASPLSLQSNLFVLYKLNRNLYEHIEPFTDYNLVTLAA